MQEPPDLSDNDTKAGVGRLVETIRAYWAKRGFAIKVESYELITSEGRRAYGVRSNLVNGLPRSDGRGGWLRVPGAPRKRVLTARI